MWGGFAFGVIGAVLAALFLRKVGIVGHRKEDDDADNSDEEKTALSVTGSMKDDTKDNVMVTEGVAVTTGGGVEAVVALNLRAEATVSGFDVVETRRDDVSEVTAAPPMPSALSLPLADAIEPVPLHTSIEPMEGTGLGVEVHRRNSRESHVSAI